MFVSRRTCREWVRVAPYSKGEGVNGGDSGYTYSGSKQGDDAGFTAKLTIKRWDPGSESVFGGLDRFELEFRGSATASGFTASASIIGRSEAN
nr:GrlR family regulatory protein [Xanthomonas citri]